MRRLLALAGMAVGGWLGWMVGSLASTYAAFLVSGVGAAVALYAFNRFVDRYLP